VALVVDPPLAIEVDGLRRALGDPSLERLPPHLTLVPPVNVRTAELPDAMALLRRAAELVDGPLRLTLGPVTSFLPDNPVLYLAVGGDLDGLRQVRDAVFAPPLSRNLSWPWVPHVTVADGIEPERVVAGSQALDRYAVVAEFDRVVLLEEQSERVWRPLGDATFGPSALVGTGGLSLHISQGRMLDPEAASLLGVTLPDLRAGLSSGPQAPIALTGRREGSVVGVAMAWTDVLGGHMSVVVDSAVRRQGIGSHLLAHAESQARRAGWPYRVLASHGPPEFYRSRSDWCKAYEKATEEY
jgi:2'-5' RNA ligase